MTSTRPVVTAVSHATRASGSWPMIASRSASEIWSQSLSGCPSVTDSEVRNSDGAVMNVESLIDHFLVPLLVSRFPFLASGLPPSRAFFPARKVRALLVRQLVDADAEGGELEARDLLIDLARDGVDAGRQPLLEQHQVLDAERLVG